LLLFSADQGRMQISKKGHDLLCVFPACMPLNILYYYYYYYYLKNNELLLLLLLLSNIKTPKFVSHQ